MEKLLCVPDIGGSTGVDVIEVAIKPGDTVVPEQTLIVLEGDKATMEIPAEFGGVIKALKVKVGDKVSEGSEIASVDAEAMSVPETKKTPQPEKTETPSAQIVAVSEAAVPSPDPVTAQPESAVTASGSAHAGPGVRRFARELGVDLTQVSGSGPKSRVLKEDVQRFVKSRMLEPMSGGAGLNLSPAPTIDFSKFGETETVPLGKIQKISGAHLHRCWVSIPHVNQFDEADITELEAFRQANKQLENGAKLTPIVFVMKAVVDCLKAMPKFNASLTPDGQSLVMKKYFHVGVAVDTPNGLVVPVIRDVDQKSLSDLALELAEISKQAREKGLTPADMQGGCFTISSLGGIGGTKFTPIVNQPEVAILGLSKSQMKPVYQDGQFVPRLMLPLCLSYDHRVIDGADGARFIVRLAGCLSDIRRVLL